MIVREKALSLFKSYLSMLIGCAAYACSTSFFLAPNSIVAGGVTGISVLVNHFFANVPVGMLSIALNIPILLLAIRFYGWRFVGRSLLTIVVLGVATDLFALLQPATADGVLASLYGGVFQGVAIGLFLKSGFSSGGTELLGRIIIRILKNGKVPLCVGILDGIIVILGAIFTKNPNNMLFAIIVIFVSTKVSETILVGIEKSKLCIIISDKGEAISEALIQASPRGVTMLDGEGMYTRSAHNVLFTCVKNRQLSQLKQIVNSVDPSAFIIINDSVEVRGKGFRSLQDKD